MCQGVIGDKNEFYFNQIQKHKFLFYILHFYPLSSINDERKKGSIFRHFFFGSAYFAKKKNEINNFISHVQINIMHISLFNCLCKKQIIQGNKIDKKHIQRQHLESKQY